MSFIYIDIFIPKIKSLKPINAMHEFSIAVNIVDIVTEEAKKNNAQKVLEIELEIGELAGVIYDAMEFAMQAAIKNTLMDGANIKIIKPEGEGICNSCQHKFSIKQLFDVCPLCGSFDVNIIKGKELRVSSIQVE